jgi:hypothetical protein
MVGLDERQDVVNMFFWLGYGFFFFLIARIYLFFILKIFLKNLNFFIFLFALN